MRNSIVRHFLHGAAALLGRLLKSNSRDEMGAMVFISYCEPNQEIAENLRNRLEELGVRAWIYSYDRLLAADSWEDIGARINDVGVFAFLVSEETLKSSGQSKELQMALKRVIENASELSILPIALNDTPFVHFLTPSLT